MANTTKATINNHVFLSNASAKTERENDRPRHREPLDGLAQSSSNWISNKILLVKDTLARNSNKHSPKNNCCSVIAKLNLRRYTHIKVTSKPVKFQRNCM